MTQTRGPRTSIPRKALDLVLRKPADDLFRGIRRIMWFRENDDRWTRNRQMLATTFGPQLRIARDQLDAIIRDFDQAQKR